MKPYRRFWWASLSVLAALLAACGADDADPGDSRGATGTTATMAEAGSNGSDLPGTSGDADEPLEGSLSVSAAASLRVALDEIGDDFMAANPEVDVVFNFDSSSTLATQILDGAPADVYASADQANMARLADAGEVDGQPDTFALNELVIVTKPGNPAGLAGLADLVDVGIIALCGEEVPCGRYAKEALDLAGVTIAETSVTRGQNVAATLTAVTEGDAVAAVVYATDAIAAGDAVERVDIPDDVNAAASYQIATLVGAADPDLARAFVDHVLSPEGQTVLEGHGFLPTP